jgi:hypothetical protein
MAHLKLNLSGHDNPHLNAEGFVFPGALHVNLADPELKTKLITFVVGLGVSSGDSVEVVLPGLAPLASRILVILHGLTGQFPFEVDLLRQEDGSFAPLPADDLQAFRNDVARAQHRQGAIVL